MTTQRSWPPQASMREYLPEATGRVLCYPRQVGGQNGTVSLGGPARLARQRPDWPLPARFPPATSRRHGAGQVARWGVSGSFAGATFSEVPAGASTSLRRGASAVAGLGHRAMRGGRSALGLVLRTLRRFGSRSSGCGRGALGRALRVAATLACGGPCALGPSPRSLGRLHGATRGGNELRPSLPPWRRRSLQSSCGTFS